MRPQARPVRIRSLPQRQSGRREATAENRSGTSGDHFRRPVSDASGSVCRQTHPARPTVASQGTWRDANRERQPVRESLQGRRSWTDELTETGGSLFELPFPSPLLRGNRTRARRRRRCVLGARAWPIPVEVGHRFRIEADHSRPKWINFLPKWTTGSRILNVRRSPARGILRNVELMVTRVGGRARPARGRQY